LVGGIGGVDVFQHCSAFWVRIMKKSKCFGAFELEVIEQLL